MKTILSALLFCVVVFGSISSVVAQRCNYWFFGDRAGLDFSSGTPVEVFNSSLYSLEGCASLADTAGNLLMYTNGGANNNTAGGAIWNRIDSVMPNGNLDSAGGCNSSAQSSIIIPDPGNVNRYYVFTTDCSENNYVGGLRFNLVDMTLDNGFGDVLIKDSFLIGNVSESLEGISHGNGTDYWVITHGNNVSSYYAYTISAAGIGPVVTSNIGSVTPFGAGQLIANCSGTKLAFADNNGGQLCDFNNVTGVVSNYVGLNFNAFGCAFSPSGRFLYMASQALQGPIHQYDLAAANIPASATVIGSSLSSNFFCNLALGPDHKIYTSQAFGYKVGCINNPDLPGVASNYVNNAIQLTRQCLAGLPNFVNTFTGACTTTGIGSPVNMVFWINYNGQAHSIQVFFDKAFSGTVQVSDAAGRTVKTMEANYITQLEVDAAEFATGVYLVKVFDTTKSQVKKVFVFN